MHGLKSWRAWLAPTRMGLLFGASWFVFLSAIAAAQNGRPMTPLDVARLEAVRSAKVSPDGSLIAYTVSKPRQPGVGDDGAAYTELHVCDFDGGNQRPFITGKVRIGQVEFSPDSQWITYVSKREDDKHSTLYAIPVGGGESRRLLEHDAGISDYELSPKGGKVAFVGTEAPSKAEKKLRDKGFTQEVYEEDYRHRRVFVADVDFETAANEARKLEALPGHAWHVHWNPKGTRLAVDLSPTPLVDDQYMFRRISVVDVESGSVLSTIQNPGKLGSFVWSNDGAAVALISGIDINDPREGRLFVARAGAELDDLLPDFKGHVDAVAYQADGGLVYLASVSVASRVGFISADGQYTVLYESKNPVFSSMSMSKDGGKLVFVGESPTHPSEVFSLDRSDGTPKRLTKSNPWLDDLALGPQVVVPYYADDETLIEGLLITPAEPTGQRLPLIVVAHGGPESHFRNGWLTAYSRPGQVAAGKGYAVFYPNYRGSTGRGVEFTKMHQGDAGGLEFDDVLAGIDHLINEGLVDRDRVGITGGSYGGFFTAWGCTRYSERFAAGVMFVGISNQLSKSGTTDIAHEMRLVHWLTTPYENLQLFLERSPVLYVDNANTPLLIMHGKEDPRVDPGQSKELFRALKMKGDVPTRLVLYPGEGHGNRRAASRYDYSLRMLRWFDNFLLAGNSEKPPVEIDYGLDDEDSDDSTQG